MDVSQIIAEFGAYYIKSDANMSRLVKQLNTKSVTETAFTTVVTDDTLWRASEGRMTRVLQPFQKRWTPIGVLTLLPAAIENFKMKIDHEEYPDDIEATWLGFLADDSLDRKEWPFIRWFIEVHLLPQAKEDYEMNEIYHGVYAAPTPGTAGAAGTAMNGIKKTINDFVDGGRISPIMTGVVPTDPEDFVDYMEAFADSLPTKYWNLPMQAVMAETLTRRFLRGKERKYGQNTAYTTNGGTNVEMTNLTLIGVPSHNGSDKIWATPKNNAIRLVKKSQNINKIRVENVDRLVKMYTDWWSGVGFVIPEIVFTNDRDLNPVDPDPDPDPDQQG
jgi:hypothetical protein